MQKLFEQFDENLKLTEAQRNDAKTKYTGVCEKLHSHFYGTTYTDKTHYLFGSYKKHTSIRPIIENQDVDIIFKMPAEKYQAYADNSGNAQSQLLQDVRNVLSEKYPTVEKITAWGKVVLVKTSAGSHNIEIVPAWEQEDKTFIIPNSEDSGKWEVIDYRAEIQRFSNSNKETNGMTRKLSRMLKSWARNIATLTIKSYELENIVMNFLKVTDINEKSYSQIFNLLFSYMTTLYSDSNYSLITSAKDRTSKALDFEKNEEFTKSAEEWRKIFGDLFPSYTKGLLEGDEEKAPDEKFIENLYKVDVDQTIVLKLNCLVTQNGFRQMFLNQIPFLKKEKSLMFSIVELNVAEPYDIFWKVRNFGEEAKRMGKLRGEILPDEGHKSVTQNTCWYGTHYIECYIIKDRVCIARKRINVPIGINKTIWT